MNEFHDILWAREVPPGTVLRVGSEMAVVDDEHVVITGNVLFATPAAMDRIESRSRDERERTGSGEVESDPQT